MNELQQFNFEGLNIRTLVIENEPFLVGKDVADVLGYSNSRDALAKHVDIENRFLLYRVNPYNQIIKNKIGLNFSETESGSTKFSVFFGIVFPEYVSAILDKETKKLSVISPSDFEKMFNLKVVRMAQARKVF